MTLLCGGRNECFHTAYASRKKGYSNPGERARRLSNYLIAIFEYVKKERYISGSLCRTVVIVKRIFSSIYHYIKIQNM